MVGSLLDGILDALRHRLLAEYDSSGNHNHGRQPTATVMRQPDRR